MMTNVVSPTRFGARAEKVAHRLDGQNTVVVTVRPESEAEAKKYSFSLLDRNMDRTTRWYGGPAQDFGRETLGSSFSSPKTVEDILNAAQLITGLKFDKGALEDTGLTEEGVKHRLLKGLARILCKDAIAFRDNFLRLAEKGRDNLTL